MIARLSTLVLSVAVVVCAALGHSTLAAQSPTGAIAGRVVSDDGNQTPVRRATVRLIGGDLDRPRGAVTDNEGRFTFSNLPAGRFTLSAAKPSFVSSSYGAKRPGRPGVPLALGNGQRVTNATIVLGRGAVISGSVRDANGEPVPELTVTALRTLANGNTAAPVTAVTDDRGQYRIFGLQPGDYLVAAVPQTAGSGDIGRMSELDVNLALADAQVGRGIRPVGPIGSVPGRGAPPPGRLQQGYTYAPIFYSGTPVAAEATKVTVVSGQESNGVDVALVLVPSASIEGTVTSPDGPLPSFSLTITTDGPGLPPQFVSRPTLAIRPTAAGAVTVPLIPGRFKYTNVPPGRYVVLAIATPPPTTLAGPGGPPPPTVMWARAEVNVSTDSVDNLSLVFRPAMTVSGRVSGQAAPSTFVSLTPADATGPAGVAFGLVQNGTLPVPAGQRRSIVSPDGTFTITGVMPGRYTIGMTGLAPEWTLTSAIVNGRDVLDAVLAVDDADVADIVLTAGARRDLTGTLQLPTGSPADDFYVIVFPADRNLWVRGSRRIRGVRPATDGRYVVTDLPAGDYLVAAVSDAESDEWNDPAFLETLVPAAVKLTVAAESNSSLDLRIAR